MNKIATQTVKPFQYCGTEIQDYAVFCSNCGKKLIELNRTLASALIGIQHKSN